MVRGMDATFCQVRLDVESLDGRVVAHLLTGEERAVRSELARYGYSVGHLDGLAAPVLRGDEKIGRLCPTTDGRAEARLDVSAIAGT